MSDYAMLDGERIVNASLSIPYYGCWAADVGLDSAKAIPDLVTLTIANLTLVGHVVRMAGFAGSRTARVVGGAGGWRKEVPQQAYFDPNGVKRGIVLRDAAAAVGEQVNVQNDQAIGLVFVREKAPAQRVLRQVLGNTWWVDNLGVMQTVARTDIRPISTEFTVVHWSGAKGSFDIATEDLAAWMPGRMFVAPTVTTPQAISYVTIKTDNDGVLRLEVLSVDQ